MQPLRAIEEKELLNQWGWRIDGSERGDIINNWRGIVTKGEQIFALIKKRCLS